MSLKGRVVGLLISLVLTTLLVFLFGCSIQSAAVSTVQGGSNTAINIWPIFILTALSGGFGGLVHALENDGTHEIRLPFQGKEADSGIWGHIFIGICGSIVALAIVMAIFGFEISPVLSNNDLSKSIKHMIYIAAVGIIGGYSGLPIISIVSNAALKKVQKQVEALETSDAKQKKQLSTLESELQNKELELQETRLQSILLTAESHARNEEYKEALDILNDKFIPINKNNPKAWMWLAFCAKRLGNINQALEYICKSIKLEKSRLVYFNKACYINLLDKPKSDVYDALNLAWEHSESYADKKRLFEGLKTDKDLTSLRDKPEYEQFIQKIRINLESMEK